MARKDTNRKERTTIQKFQQEQIVNLNSQITNMRTENNDLKRQLKAAWSKHSIVDIIKSDISTKLKPYEALPKTPIYSKPKGKVCYEEHLVLHISDQHADQIVKSESVGGLENYNLNIALCRAETYTDRVLKYIHNLSNYKFPVLWILMYGDHVSGEIHGAEKESYYKNMFQNSMAVGQMNSLIIRDLAPYFQKVNVICISGNHGRRTNKKEYYGPKNNWDYLVFETCRMLCKEHTNVAFTIPDAFSVNVDINGWGFNIQHGDDIPSFNSLPWYGIERKTRRLVALNSSKGRHIDYFVMGHFHTGTMMSHLNGETIINGAWLATDPYCYNRLATYNIPRQWIHGVDDKWGVTWRMNVNLIDEKKEKIGIPSRYKVELG